MELPKFSRSKIGTYDDMINLMCVFSVKHQSPVYYRLLPGNIKDVSAFKLCLKESGVKEAIVVMDKGFASRSNIEAIENSGLKFIIPLQRNNTLINYEKIESGDKRLFDGYFMHEKRCIWYYSIPVDAKKTITVFLDDELRVREQKDYLRRIENDALDYSMDKFYGKQYQLGTIALIENTGKPPSDVYVNYKTRGDVETMISTLKNIVDADRTYMQNQTTLEGWMFINLIAMKWYYATLNLIKKHGLNKKYSTMDFLMSMAEIKKVKINEQWHDAEITKKTKEILKKLNIIHIT
jgi:transposase